MVVNDPHPGGIFTCKQRQINVEHQLGLRRRNIDGDFSHILLQGQLLLLGHRSNDLQLLGSIACNHTGTNCRSDATQATGIGHNNTLDILDNIAADQNIDPLRHNAQHLTGLCACVSQCDGLGTTHRGPQFFLQDRNKLLV